MRHSEALDQIAPALVKAQQAIPTVRKDAANPHFRNRYASLDAITEAAVPALTAQGITLLQGGGQVQDDAGIEVVTRLLHTSGQWIESGIRLPLAKSDPQGAGSAITYGRRYGLAAILGIVADEDDDAEAAVRKVESKAKAAPAPAPSSPTRHAVPPCPKCGGVMWDNREGKKNPKAPDFKCKDKECVDERGFGTALWQSDLERDPTLTGVYAGMDQRPPQLDGDDDLPY